MTTSSPALLISDLCKRYGDVKALRGVDLEVKRGEVFGLIGPNGSGKTTMVECALGLRKPDSGTIRINDLNPALNQRKLAHSLGVVFQNGGIDDSLKLTHYFAFRTSYGKQPVDEDLTWQNFRLVSKKNARYGSLSGGQQQRALIATTLAARPVLAIMDEPTSGLDPQSRYDFWQSLRMTAAGDTSVLVTTHNLGEAQDYCDRVAIMDKGRILCFGATKKLLKEYGMSVVLQLTIDIGSDTKPLEEELVSCRYVTRSIRRFDSLMVHITDFQEGSNVVGKLLTGAGYSEDRFSLRPGSLEDLFFHLIQADVGRLQ